MKKMMSFVAILLFSISVLSASEKVVNLFLVGPGLVGSELLNQVHHHFCAEQPIAVRVVAIANTRLMHFEPSGIDLSSWKKKLTHSKHKMEINKFIQNMVALNLPHSVFVDCTSNQTIAESYPKILQSGISVVTPNKKANSSSYSLFCELKDLAAQNHVSYLYDTNVGAGLPIIHMIQAMKRSGDSIVKIEAILSGTLSYLFNTFDGTVPFSQAVRDAQMKGYTEPDPRDDLDGMDMARKFLILAREAGYKLEMGDITIDCFLADDCFEASSVDEFYQRLAAYDDNASALAKETQQKGEVLRFIGTLEEGKVTLSLQSVGADHPFYNLSNTDNIVSITSRNYSKNPIVIKGPGAGASVTAANVLANIIQAGGIN